MTWRREELANWDQKEWKVLQPERSRTHLQPVSTALQSQDDTDNPIQLRTSLLSNHGFLTIFLTIPNLPIFHNPINPNLVKSEIARDEKPNQNDRFFHDLKRAQQKYATSCKLLTKSVVSSLYFSKSIVVVPNGQKFDENQTVGLRWNVVPGSSLLGKTSRAVTTASGGPRRHLCSISCTASGLPENRASTDPSFLFRTQPFSPNCVAFSIVQFLYHTP
ncbi:hypothetical protein G2W53_024103 [Senna tora]|uniref:Uncharacterized protein n=1 Tax=Senna tora TaxID=362788 RepID=A0A834TAL4_9FABA|nr:hypothetical protein G2W53_024103 [Senna tora]